MLRPLLFLAALTFPFGALAASVPDQSLLALQSMDQRVATIGHRLARANVDICDRTMPLSGMLVHALDQYSAAARPIAASTFGIGGEPAILVVVPGSAAARAGLQVGDGILSIAGKAFPLKEAGKKASYERVQEVEEFLLSSLAAGPVAVEAHSASLAPPHPNPMGGKRTL